MPVHSSHLTTWCQPNMSSDVTKCHPQLRTTKPSCARLLWHKGTSTVPLLSVKPTSTGQLAGTHFLSHTVNEQQCLWPKKAEGFQEMYNTKPKLLLLMKQKLLRTPGLGPSSKRLQAVNHARELFSIFPIFTYCIS